MRNAMNTVLLNVVSLDDGRVIKKGGSAGGGGVTINNQDKVVDIAENGTTEVTADAGFTGLGKVNVNVAIPTEEKTIEIVENGTTEVMAENGYLSKVVVNVEVPSSGGGSTTSWTGHADAEGLRAIGWTDEDIEYYQENGVNWNEEDDEYHKVPAGNKALYGVLTASNISNYRDRIVYLPKIDTSAKTSMLNMFAGCSALVSIPQLDTSKVTNMNNMFGYCYSLVSIPQLDTTKVTTMTEMFSGCHSLVSIPQLDTSNVTTMNGMFTNCYSLTTANLKNVKLSLQLNNATYLSKESLLYIINNEATTSAITIKLVYYAYYHNTNDADVVAALANHPNISISY